MKGQLWSQKLIWELWIIQNCNKAVLEALGTAVEMIPEPETTPLKETALNRWSDCHEQGPGRLRNFQH